jgi:hypothetical protein
LVLEEGFILSQGEPGSPLPCNFYDPTPSSDDFLPNALAWIPTIIETVTVTGNFTCTSGTNYRVSTG